MDAVMARDIPCSTVTGSTPAPIEIGTGRLALTYPISPSPNAVNQTRFPGPGHIHQTYGIVVAGTKYSVNDPVVGSYLATLPAKCSENHIIPLESRAIALGSPTAQSGLYVSEQYPMPNTLHSPVEGLKLPNWLAPWSVNQTTPP